MATTLDPGSGGDTIRTQEKAGEKTPVSLIDVGGTGTENLVTDGTQGMPTEGVAAENAAVVGNPVLVGGRFDSSARTIGDGKSGAIALDADGAVHVSNGGNSLTVDGTVTANAGTGPWPVTDNGGSLTVDDGGSPISVDDNGGSLTVDNAALSVTGGGVESGALRVTLANDSTGVVSVDDNGSTLSVDDGGGNLSVDWGGTTPPIGAGTEAAALRVTVATDSTGVLSVDDNGSTLSVDDGAGSLTVDNAALSVTGGGVESGALRVTIANDSTGLVSVDDNGGSLTVDGTVTANLSATDNAVLDNIDTQTSPAASFYRNIDANAEAAIKGSAGVLHWVNVMNMTAAVAYLHLYNATTASVTPGTTTPDLTFPIPTQGDTNGAGFNLPLGPNGQDFDTAITLVCTTTNDGSAGDPGTNGVFVNAGYT